MTNEESLKNIVEDGINLFAGDFVDLEALKVAAKALEKQIPMRPIHNHHCPNCGYGLPIKGITDDFCSCCFKQKYCPDCGQAIDWSFL